MTVHGRYVPPVVLTYAVLQIVAIAYGLANSTKLWHHPPAAAAVVLLLMLWLAGIVVWRRRWVWALVLLAYLVGLVEPAWKWNGVFRYVWNLVILALLVSAPLRRYVGAVRRPATAERR